MNRAKLKNYAPQARRDFIQAVTDRATYYGLTPNKIEPVIEKGEIALISGRAFPLALAQKRKALEERISRQGFEQVMEAMAYTWFNRFVAIRFMELHGYFDHGYRVLSNPEGKMIPEILEHAEHVDLPGLNKDKAIELKLDGAKEDELYRLILIAQCNALHSAMPFLFEWVNDETELLLPDNLMHSDSLIRKLVNEINEEDWQEVEIIGWLYEFYISEKKAQVIGKVVKSEDIPAATQLFTPNWIVKYMVQNALGRQWLATYLNSPLKQKMEFYIEPAEQTPEVQAQLKVITPENLDPEEITLLDPACGSGHILVEAYDLFKSIYQERGYRAKDISRLILEKNLYGLEIDDRASQMAGFALLMKARKDDRCILQNGNQPRLNVMAIQGSEGLNAQEISGNLLVGTTEVSKQDIAELVELFRHGKTFGSLIKIPEVLAQKLPALSAVVEEKLRSGNMFARQAAETILPFVKQANILARKYDCVVANPPYMYMGGNGMNNLLKEYGKANYEDYNTDLYSMFIIRIVDLTNANQFSSVMSPFTWMSLKSFEKLRNYLLSTSSIKSLIHPEYHAFFDSAYVPICTFSLQKTATNYTGTFIDLNEFYGESLQPVKTLEGIHNRNCEWVHESNQLYFNGVPNKIIAYSLSNTALNCFFNMDTLHNHAELKQGLITGDNELFLRLWSEISVSNSSIKQKDAHTVKWFPYQKGGAFRKWYGNNEYVVNWHKCGNEIRNFKDNSGKLRSRPQNISYYFKEGASWTSLTVSNLSMRYVPEGYIFDAKGPMLFSNQPDNLFKIISYCNTNVINVFLKVLAPTMDFSQGPVGNVPFKMPNYNELTDIAREAISITRIDWDSFETSWDFQSFPWLTFPLKAATIAKSWQNWVIHCATQIKRMQELETENNRIFIEAYGLQDELTPEVPEEQITLARADREKDINWLISYAIGCIMGRYSLDKPGLVYAHIGNNGFDHSQYKTFPADQDGIIPVMEADWFPDDAPNRIAEFIAAVWSKEHLEENLRFIAESLGPNKGEQPRDTIRRYLATGFFKDHLKTYKNRPIYWLFSSGKLRAFQCLVYLHRYNESTLSRMRTEYVIPLQGKIASRIEQLSGDIQKASSTSHRKKMEKERDNLVKQQAELQSFDEKLRHYADIRISLDLDDGVKVSYGKFGDLLAEVKTVTGGSQE